MEDTEPPNGSEKTSSGKVIDRQRIFEPLALLDDLPVREHIAFVDRHANDQMLGRSGVREYLEQFENPDNSVDIENADTSALSPEAQQKLSEFKAQLKVLHDEVSTDDARERLYQIASRNISVGEGDISAEKYDKVMVFDVDGTLTDPTHRIPGESDSLLPGSAVFDPLIGKKREHFTTVFAAGWAPLMGRASIAFERGARETSVREGMAELIKAQIAKGVEVKLVTTNFEPYVNAFLKKMLGEDFDTGAIEIFCMRKNDARASSKGDLLKKIALENANALVSYVGDSTSDFPVTEAGDAIYQIYALENESFDRKLNEEMITHCSFRNGADIAQNLGIELPNSPQPLASNG